MIRPIHRLFLVSFVPRIYGGWLVTTSTHTRVHAGGGITTIIFVRLTAQQLSHGLAVLIRKYTVEEKIGGRINVG